MVSKENGVGRDDQLSEMEKNVKQSRGESDYDLTRDSLSSQGETASNEDSRSKRSSRVPKKLVKNEPANNSGRASRAKNNNQGNTKLQFKSSVNDQKRVKKTGDKIVTPKSVISKTLENTNVTSGPSSEGSEEMDDKPTEEVKEIDVLDEVHNCDQSIGTDDEMVDTEENGVDDDKVRAHRKIDELESIIEKLEEELREVAALEISLYSVAPEHGSSAHKIHTSARRLSRLYVHACKYWTPERKATVARNTVSGLVLVSKSCGSDVPRLTFWLSNTIFLRKIIHQTFGNLSQSNGARRTAKANGSAKKADEIFASPKRKSYSGFKQAKNVSLMQLENDWHDIHTFTTALEEVESWMFSRIVESIWWQTLTPYMQSPAEEMNTPRGLQKLLGPALGDRQQGNFSINLWKNAFQDAFARLCPIRSGGHECGCLPVLARMVMEQCVSRLDVAMFNAILRESAYELPTDPLSDPIVDPRVLPISAGDLSFGSGAQLKNAIGNWSRWLTDLFGMDTEDSLKDDSDVTEDYDMREGNAESKSFCLLNELSDLLMLPKDMLLETSIRKEVCPSICLPLVIRVLCNFSLDEFCPEPVPGFVLEELNTECILQRKLSVSDPVSSFPYVAQPVVYSLPLPTDVALNVGIFPQKSELDRRASVVQKKGYTSDDDLDDLDSPLTSIMDQICPVSPVPINGSKQERWQPNLRYKLLGEVWSA